MKDVLFAVLEWLNLPVMIGTGMVLAEYISRLIHKIF
jgi:hypothetical protein